MLPALDFSPPITEWGGEQVAVDFGHRAVYAAVVSAAYLWLDG